MNKDAKDFPSWWTKSPPLDLFDTPTLVFLPEYKTPLPLSHFFHEWECLPGVSSWALRTVRSGYTLQFGRNPPLLRQGSPDSSKQCLKGFCATAGATAGTVLPPQRGKRGSPSIRPGTRLFQPLFPCAKEGRRLRPSPFTKGSSRCWRWRLLCLRFEWETGLSLLTWKILISTFRSSGSTGSCFRFAFGGKAYQYKVLAFGLGLAPRTFTKCMDAALAPLRLQGIRVLNYLDYLLILAHSRESVSCHRDVVLRHVRALGLRTNTKKSVLSPSQQTVFLGVHLESVQMQTHLAPAQISSLNTCLAHFKLDHHVFVRTCRRLLCLMAAASHVHPKP